MQKLPLESALRIVAVFLQVSKQIVNANTSASGTFLFSSAAHQLRIGFNEFLGFIPTGVPEASMLVSAAEAFTFPKFDMCLSLILSSATFISRGVPKCAKLAFSTNSRT